MGYANVTGFNPAMTVFFAATLPVRQLRNEDAPFSIGIRRSDRWIKQAVKDGRARLIDRDTWNHSGCQSSCIRRGGKTCRW